ncbi:GNAT family N-acetyltransferase [Paenibacillus sp. FSL H8-0034]|uniref:GNAT family N-acetyltransferase n=1 Tax=Paenibacillus sp. FSL H8-0034 TaxID=2954671 RepID=UPI0030FA5DBE
MSTLDIRQIHKEHAADSIALSEFAFQMELTPQQREERFAFFNEQESWGAYVDGKLAARLSILDLHTWLHGKRFEMGGIAGVATWPEYRRGGLVTGLLHNALRVMKEQGQTLSFLHPFQFAFYRKFGWETYTDYMKYEIPTAMLPKLPLQTGSIVRVDDQIPLLNGIYRSYAVRYNGTLDRDEQWWKRRIFASKKGTAAVYRDEAGVPGGYVFYDVKNSICKIHEMIALNYEAEQALWKFIADHDSMIEKVTLQAPADNRLSFLLDNPRIKQELVPYFMARIVDVVSFLEQFPFAVADDLLGTGMRETELTLHIRDRHAEWNDGSFTIKIDAFGTAKVEKLQAGQTDLNELAVECDISTLAAMFMGYQRPEFLHSINRLQGSEESIRRLEALIPRRQTYLPDFF